MSDLIARYRSVKAIAASGSLKHPEFLLAVCVGDFYEFYDADAEIAARVLEITLTGRESNSERVPMAGVPVASVERYLAKLLAAGYRTALCDDLPEVK